MEKQRFIPEGWEQVRPITPYELNEAYKTGEIMNGLVTRCDSNYNLFFHTFFVLVYFSPHEL